MSWFKRARTLLVPGGGWISPGGFLRRAAVLVAMSLVAHLLGWREYATLLSGTSPNGGPIGLATALPAAFYIFSWFAATLITPALIIGAGFLWFIDRRNKTSMPVGNENCMKCGEEFERDYEARGRAREESGKNQKPDE